MIAQSYLNTSMKISSELVQPINVNKGADKKFVYDFIIGVDNRN